MVHFLKRRRFFATVCVTAVVTLFSPWATSARLQEETNNVLSIPSSTKHEHETLLSRLDAAVNTGGKTGEAAVQLKKVLMPHFAEEEQLALPPLGALLPLSRGELSKEAREAVRQLSSRLKQEMPSMLKEHEVIGKAVSSLRDTASLEGKQEVVEFADDLKQHAKNEEEVLYPAAIIAGECRGTAP